MDLFTSKVLTYMDPGSVNHDFGVISVAISPNGQWVAAGCLDTAVRIWDMATAQLVEQLQGHRDGVYSIAFTPDGQGLVSGSLDNTMKYWDISGLNTSVGGSGMKGVGEEELCTSTMDFIGHKNYVLSVAVSRDGQWVVSGSKDRTVQFRDARSGVVQCMLRGHRYSGGSFFLRCVVQCVDGL